MSTPDCTMYCMYFKKPMFKMGGLQTTIRLGTKWHKLNPGDTLKLKTSGSCENPDEKVGKAYVNGALYERLDRLPQWVLEKEHDPKARTKEGLKSVLRDVYRHQILPGAVNDKSCITVVFFHVTELEDQYLE